MQPVPAAVNRPAVGGVLDVGCGEHARHRRPGVGRGGWTGRPGTGPSAPGPGGSVLRLAPPLHVTGQRVDQCAEIVAGSMQKNGPHRRALSPTSPVILEDETDSVLVAPGLAVVILPAEVGLDPPALAQFKLHAGLVLLAAPDALARVVEHIMICQHNV